VVHLLSSLATTIPLSLSLLSPTTVSSPLTTISGNASVARGTVSYNMWQLLGGPPSPLGALWRRKMRGTRRMMDFHLRVGENIAASSTSSLSLCHEKLTCICIMVFARSKDIFIHAYLKTWFWLQDRTMMSSTQVAHPRDHHVGSLWLSTCCICLPSLNNAFLKNE
jgi:hypothetical protein